MRRLSPKALMVGFLATQVLAACGARAPQDYLLPLSLPEAPPPIQGAVDISAALEAMRGITMACEERFATVTGLARWECIADYTGTPDRSFLFVAFLADGDGQLLAIDQQAVRIEGSQPDGFASFLGTTAGYLVPTLDGSRPFEEWLRTHVQSGGATVVGTVNVVTERGSAVYRLVITGGP